ncbi:hypothetical protein V1281_003764 [Nitrobacteraceae bacterium AZCC 2161]
MGDFCPRGRASGYWASIRPAFASLHPHPSSSRRADPRSGVGQLPRASRVRRDTSSPRPQAPHSQFHRKTPHEAPLANGIQGNIIKIGLLSTDDVSFFFHTHARHSPARQLARLRARAAPAASEPGIHILDGGYGFRARATRRLRRRLARPGMTKERLCRRASIPNRTSLHPGSPYNHLFHLKNTYGSTAASTIAISAKG